MALPSWVAKVLAQLAEFQNEELWHNLNLRIDDEEEVGYGTPTKVVGGQKNGAFYAEWTFEKGDSPRVLRATVGPNGADDVYLDGVKQTGGVVKVAGKTRGDELRLAFILRFKVGDANHQYRCDWTYFDALPFI
jgi:hypothetical protein